MTPLAPTFTAPLFAPLHDELMRLLRSLAPEDWNAPTVAGDWRVRDVAAHLLDSDLRALSALRDGHSPPPDTPIGGYADLVRFLDRLNADWITASRRLSPRVIVDLLAVTGPEAAATYSALPPHEPALYSVAWAGEAVSENWMHVGRDYTERWHHQMQIRDAVGAEGLFAPRWFRPLLDLSLRVLPHAYRDAEAEEGASLVVRVDGLGAWSLVREDAGWTLYEGVALSPQASIALDADTAWKTLYHGLTPAAARSRANVEGGEALAAPFFAARSVMVASL